MKQRIFLHFQDYLIQYISHQYQDRGSFIVIVLNIFRDSLLRTHKLGKC
jgi:hypothetical protein